MPKADELRAVRAEELRKVTADRLRSFDAGDIRDVTAEELEELCEAPGDLGCAEQIGNVIPKEDTHPGTGLRRFDGKVQEIDSHEMLGE
jgi:hypothetical protein